MQEEEKLKQDKTENAHFVSTSKAKGKRKRSEDPKKEAAKGLEQKKQSQERKCFFCNKTGHKKKKCAKYHAWRVKKGMFLTLVCSEVNLASVPSNTWWLDLGATTNISVSMKGCLNYQKPTNSERGIYVGDGKSVEVDAIGNFRLLLCTRFYLDLKETFVVSSFRRNLVLVSYLDKFVFIWKQLI